MTKSPGSLLEFGGKKDVSTKVINLLSAIAYASELDESDKDDDIAEETLAEDWSAEYPDNNALGIKLVDMGTSVLWADRNLGASAPEMEGDYYSWGQLDRWGNNLDISWLIQDIKGCLDYDVVRKELGKGWSIPSYEDWQELMRVCNVIRSGSKFIVRSRKTEKMLIFPDSFIFPSDNSRGRSETSLWTSKPYQTYNNRVYNSYIVRFGENMIFDVRDPKVKLNIRPIYTPKRNKEVPKAIT